MAARYEVPEYISSEPRAAVYVLEAEPSTTAAGDPEPHCAFVRTGQKEASRMLRSCDGCIVSIV